MNNKTIVILQVFSVTLIWGLVLSITALCIHLIHVAYRVHDVPDATVAISIIAILIFWVLGSILTYVFVGLHKQRG